MKPDEMRRRLERLRTKTASAAVLKPAGYWVGDVAGERKARDDFASGRQSWRQAYRDAVAGLEDLEAGDLEMAGLYLWTSTDHYIAALEAIARPADMKGLSQAARPRGRPKKNC